MSTRTFLIFVLFVSLLFGPQARFAASALMEKKMPRCVMMTCVTGCCAEMACCPRSAEDHRRSEQAPAPQRMNLELAVLSLRTFTILYGLPKEERRLVVREEAQWAHTLPRLAATCIQLI